MVDREKAKKAVLVLLGISFALGALLFFLLGERFVQARLPQTGPLVLIDQPVWASQTLVDKIYRTVGSREFPLRQENAAAVASLLEGTGWLRDVRVQITHDALHARAHWHRPVALVHSGTTRFYVDANAVALEHVALTNMPLVTIRGVPLTRPPTLGRVVEREDLQAAVALIVLMQYMDQQTVPTKPLLHEIDRIDVDNFRGRRKRSAAHIMLYAKDNTPIEWGAEIGAYAQFVEASDDEKLARLYTYYQEMGTVQGGVKEIVLRDPREIPHPVERAAVPGH